VPKLKDDVESGKFREMGKRFEGLTAIIFKARNDPEALSRAKKRHSKKELSHALHKGHLSPCN
jgi:hypothetical protein